jgi:hypothetical protein
MSDNDSFMAEVSDEVRRDRLFALFRRWAWLAILVVLLVVGGAAWNEWRKSRATSAAQELGDAVLAALLAPDAAARAEALAGIAAEGDAGAFIAMLAAAEAVAGGADVVVSNEEAAERAETARWQDAARLKAILAQADDLSPEERIARLEPLTAAGAPYRLLALEQTAYARVEQGETDAAVALLRDVIADGGVSEGLRWRASRMINALGGTIEPGAGG